MNKKLIALTAAAVMVAPTAAHAKPEIKWFGFAQLTAESLSQNKASDRDGFKFGADRVRIGFKLKEDKIFGKLQVDFNKSGNDSNGFKEIIKDAEAGYKFNNAASLKIGQYKTPLGMDFNTSGKKLDITKRGMEKKLVLERSQGLMLSGRKMNGFGYDLFYGNTAARSSAVTGSSTSLGRDVTTVVRVMYDKGEMLHVEASTGTSENAGGSVASEDYSVTDLAVKFKMAKFTVKAEYILGSDVRGTNGRDETVYFIHGDYSVNKMVQVLARYYAASADGYAGNGNTSTDLTNLYLGVNFFLGSNKTNGRLQLNYVITGGDNLGSTPTYTGVSSGYTDDAILVQYQVSF